MGTWHWGGDAALTYGSRGDEAGLYLAVERWSYFIERQEVCGAIRGKFKEEIIDKRSDRRPPPTAVHRELFYFRCYLDLPKM